MDTLPAKLNLHETRQVLTISTRRLQISGTTVLEGVAAGRADNAEQIEEGSRGALGRPFRVPSWAFEWEVY